MSESPAPYQPKTKEERSSQERYSDEWFKNRAINSLEKISDGVWDFSDSLLLYIPGTEEEYEAIQQVETPYHKMVTEPERAYLETIADQIVAALPDNFDYIDLGPGTEHKEQFIFNAAKQQNKQFRYIPVDISEKFLILSQKYAEDQGIETDPKQVPFEELAEALHGSERPRFVSLGLTYSNYNPDVILPLLKAIAGENGSVFINSQMRDRVDMNEIRRIYNNDALPMTTSKLALLGLNFETDVESIETDDGIRIWCTLRNSNALLEKMGINAGTRLLIFQSLRSTKEELKENTQRYFESPVLLDTNGPFIGAILESHKN